jgi:hypothetical protein
MCTYTHIWLRTDCTWITLLPNNTASETIVHKSEGCGVFTTCYHWGAGWAVTGQIRDTGQNFLQYYFQTGSSSSHRYCHICFLITFPEEDFIRNTIIILCISYIIIICIIYNNAAVNNEYWWLQDLILLFNIPTGTRKDFFEIDRKFEQTSSERFSSPALRSIEMTTATDPATLHHMPWDLTVRCFLSLIRHHAIHTWEVLICSTLDGGERSASCSSRFNCVERGPTTLLVGDRFGPVVEVRWIFAPVRNRRTSVLPVGSQYADWAILALYSRWLQRIVSSRYVEFGCSFP